MTVFLDMGSASTTRELERAKIKRPRRAPGNRRRKALPVLSAGRRGPYASVTVTLTPMRGSQAWLEVRYDGARFFVNHDVCAYDLVRQVIKGGHWVEEVRGD